MRNTAIYLRARAEQRDLIDCAARTLGKHRSDFILEAACEKAQGIMLDQVFFRFDNKNFRDLRALLNAPSSANPALKRLLVTVSPWETIKSR